MPARIIHNFSDELAYLERWHATGKRYLSLSCFVVATENAIRSTLERLATILSPDDRFAVDLQELGSRDTGKPVHVDAYVFKHCGIDDHAFLLGSLEKAEVDEIIGLLDATSCVTSYAATELVSTATRGKAVIARRFSRKRDSSPTMAPSHPKF